MFQNKYLVGFKRGNQYFKFLNGIIQIKLKFLLYILSASRISLSTLKLFRKILLMIFSFAV